MSPAEIARDALGVPAAAITGVERIKHGLTNESWLVRTSADAVVVRVSNAAESELQIDRVSEAAILEAVSDADIGAVLLGNDLGRRVLVTRYLGPTWTHEEALDERNIDRLAALLRRLHALPPPAGAHRVDLATSVAGYLATLEVRGEGAVLRSQPLRQRAADAAAMLGDPAAACLCHNDVHHLNIVDDGQLRLIDWEYAGIGEPLFDLASVCVYHRYDSTRTERLLRQYLPTADARIRERVEHAKWLFGYIRDLWLAVRENP